jgi:RNA polymerase sigma-70 factor (ECF subfamily)
VEARTEIGRALDSLTPRQRAAVVLVDLLGYPTDEASRALGVTPSTVRVLLARGRQALRETIGAPDG